MAIETLPEASLPVTRPFRVKFGFLTSTPIIAVATICLVLIILMAIFAPLLAPRDPLLLTPSLRLKPSSAQYLLGTDAYGRDLLSRIIYGARISLVIGLGAAVDYIGAIGLDNISAHEEGILQYATERLSKVEGLRIIGTALEKASIISFNMEGVHPHDLGTFVDRQGVAVRVGHHCAQPVMERYGVAATARASFGLYNTLEEIDVLIDALNSTKEFFG